jgi:hypothetical protein
VCATLAAGLSVCGLVGASRAASAATTTVAPSPQRMHVQLVRVLHTTVRMGADEVGIRVTITCSRESTAEIDGVLRQRSSGAQASGSLLISCSPRPSEWNLVFQAEGRDFGLGWAVFDADASAGFLSSFSHVHLGPVAVYVRRHL